MNNLQEVIDRCQSVADNLIKLPDVQLDRKLYTEVANALNKAGGKWDRKAGGFKFESGARKLLLSLQNGDRPNPKKEFQFFETPTSLAKQMASLLKLEQSDKVLEPSAGRGSLVRAVHYWYPGKMVYGYELMPENREYLKSVPHFTLVGEDFTECRDFSAYDKIIANPPFRNKQDIQHILKMWHCLKPGGRIVTLASPSFKTGSDRLSTYFKEFVDRYAVYVSPVKAGTFKESGTNVETVLIVLFKPKSFLYEGESTEIIL